MKKKSLLWGITLILILAFLFYFFMHSRQLDLKYVSILDDSITIQFGLFPENNELKFWMYNLENSEPQLLSFGNVVKESNWSFFVEEEIIYGVTNISFIPFTNDIYIDISGIGYRFTPVEKVADY